MKFFDEDGLPPSRKINLLCFLLPILSILPPALFSENGATALGFVASFSFAFLAFYLLLFRPARRIRQAAWACLCGFAVAIALSAWGAYIIWNQALPIRY